MISNTFSLLQHAAYKDWTWNNLASGYWHGLNVGHGLLKSQPRIVPVKWLITVAQTFKVYNQAHSLGFFKKYPFLLRPIQIGAVALTAYNAFNLYNKFFSEDSDAQGFTWKTKSPFWNYASKILSVGIIAGAVLEFQKKPIETIALLATVVITMTSHQISSVLKKGKLGQLPKVTAITLCAAASASQIWNGNWLDGSVSAIKAVDYFKIYQNKKKSPA